MDSETRTGAGEVPPPGQLAVPERSRRSDFVKRGVIVGGVALAGAAVAGGPRLTDAAQLSQPDQRALELLLLVEYTEEAFYAEALRRGELSGKVLQYAQTVAEQEKQHLEAIAGALGGRAESKPEFDFGDKTGSSEAFATAAGDLEDLSVAAYNGQGTNVSKEILAAAGKIVSVEARHAAWIRSIVGEPPAPDTTDTPQSANEVLEGLQQAGMRR
jgi:Ferritin-like domain